MFFAHNPQIKGDSIKFESPPNTPDLLCSARHIADPVNCLLVVESTVTEACRNRDAWENFRNWKGVVTKLLQLERYLIGIHCYYAIILLFCLYVRSW